MYAFLFLSYPGALLLLLRELDPFCEGAPPGGLRRRVGVREDELGWREPHGGAEQGV